MTSPHSTSKSNEPEAYQIGWVPFLGATIYLDSHPLIPRTETEWWVERAITQMRECVARGGAPQAGSRGLGDFSAEKSAYPERATPSALRVLDLFAGSGCIGIAVLKHVPSAHVDFGEKETRHFPTIERNIRENGIDPARARVIETDVWSNIEDAYDFVLANPPYLSPARIERIQDSVLEHEPKEALFADNNGFEFIEKVLTGLPTHLAPGSQAWVEHEPEHCAKIKGTARANGLRATVHKDQYGVERYSVILKP